jgi:hypothetical protein
MRRVALLLQRIGTERGSRVIAYATCGRKSLGTQIGADSIRFFREALGQTQRTEKLDLLLVTRGGHTLTPLRLMSLLRE